MTNMAIAPSSSKLIFREKLAGQPWPFDPENSLLIFDRRLLTVSREFKTWCATFPHRHGVASGEGLKDIQAFPSHVRRLSVIADRLAPAKMTVVVVGGGSVGDFAGFFASVYKRGVRLVHVPSTWLAAIDSSHGGKTALNVAGAKNQIGTFYPAAAVVLVKSLLLAQPKERAIEAMGELGKIALLDGGSWVRKLERSRREGGELIWEFLKPAIESKLAVVGRDPFERKGERQILNLGHTVGHVLEAAHGLAHGEAVAQGLFFALEFSEHSGLLTPNVTDRAMRLLSERLGLKPELGRKKLSARRFRELLLKDKKRSGADQVVFVFLKSFGHPVRASVGVDELLAEAGREGLV